MPALSNNKPSDFDGYWSKTLEELSGLPAAPETDPIPIRSAEFATMYGVRLTSIGPYRLFAYLSIPKGNGPFPAIYYVPRYGSVLEPIPKVRPTPSAAGSSPSPWPPGDSATPTSPSPPCSPAC